MIRFPFWGTRGSLPVALTAADVRARVVAALRGTISRDLMPIEEIQQYVDNLDLDVRGTSAGHTSYGEVNAGGSDYVPGNLGSGVRLSGRAALTQSRRSWPTRDDSRRLRARKHHCTCPPPPTVSKSHFDPAADS